MTANSRGFSLIELLIVLTIILVIAAVAIPNFLRSRVAANEASAEASVRTLTEAEATYFSTYGAGYSVDIRSLAPPSTTGSDPSSTAAGLIDSILASGIKSGYSFTYSPGVVDSTGRINTFNLSAIPISSSTGTNTYSTDESGVISLNGSSGGNSPTTSSASAASSSRNQSQTTLLHQNPTGNSAQKPDSGSKENSTPGAKSPWTTR